MKISTECYIPLLKIRFLRIWNSLDNTIYLNLYFSNKNQIDYYYSIVYDTNNNKRYLYSCIRGQENDPLILWKD
jgi:hypothetical protein